MQHLTNAQGHEKLSASKAEQLAQEAEVEEWQGDKEDNSKSSPPAILSSKPKAQPGNPASAKQKPKSPSLSPARKRSPSRRSRQSRRTSPAKSKGKASGEERATRGGGRGRSKDKRRKSESKQRKSRSRSQTSKRAARSRSRSPALAASRASSARSSAPLPPTAGEGTSEPAGEPIGTRRKRTHSLNEATVQQMIQSAISRLLPGSSAPPPLAASASADPSASVQIQVLGPPILASSPQTLLGHAVEHATRAQAIAHAYVSTLVASRN